MIVRAFMVSIATASVLSTVSQGMHSDEVCFGHSPSKMKKLKRQLEHQDSL